MGWTFPYSTTSRDQVVDYLLREYGDPGLCEIIDHSRRGNVLYAVFHHHPKDYRFIVVFLLQGPSPRARRQGDRTWGYKDMDESMGPCYYGCPERLLRQSDVHDEQAVAWREACRQQRVTNARLRHLSRQLQAGQILQVAAGWDANGQRMKPVEFVRSYSPTFFIGKDEAGKLWRYRWSSVVITSDQKKEVA